MKKPGLFAASFAATATAITSASPASSLSSSNFSRGLKFHPCSEEDIKEPSSKGREEASDRFVPRFDGLRFIETLVTAHR